MCGIAGFAGLQDRALLEAMTQTLRHRGPDDEGYYHEQGVGLGSRRLAIIDLAAGPQPISGENGNAVVVFNGEIYNHRELRRELEAKGHRFKTRTDTEVIVHLYEELGPQAVERLSGMFALALWDAKRRTLLLARDPLGVKPLYYAVRGRRLYFGSEVKALLKAGDVSRELDFGGLTQYLDFLYVASPASIYRDVRKLAPGELLLWRDGAAESRSFWRPAPGGPVVDARAAVGELDALLERIVEDQKVSDVPVGLFLSGGLDSSALAYYLARGGARPQAFCASFSSVGKSFDEVDKARAVAKHFGFALEELQVEPDVEGALDAIVEAFDEPLADSSALPTYWISRLARRGVKVALTGVGGDEVFSGYPRYLGAKLLPFYQALPSPARRALAVAADRAPEQLSSRNVGSWARRFVGAAGSPEEAYGSWMGHLSPQDRRALFSPALLAVMPERSAILEAFAAVQGPFLKRVQAVDLRTYLPDDLLALADRASMSVGLELRVPLCDRRLVEFALRLPPRLQVRGTTLKPLLKDLLAGKLPPDILAQKKQGFMIPLAVWFKDELRPLLSASVDALKKRRLLRADGLDRLMGEHLSGRRNRVDVLWSWILLERWLARYAPTFRLDEAAPKAPAPGPRLLHLVTRLDVGGCAENVALSADGARREGFDVAIASGPSENISAAARGVPVVVLPALRRELSPLSDVRAFFAIMALLRRRRPDILHTHSSKAGALGRWAAAASRVLWGYPRLVVHTPHGHVFYGYFGRVKSHAFLLVERATAALGGILVALSDGERRESLALGVGRKDQWRVVPSGVILDEPAAPAPPADGALTVGTVARLEPVKGVGTLIEAAGLLLASEKRPLRFVIVGDGALRSDLKDRVRALGIAERVVFAGYQERPASLMKGMDVYVQPSLNEGMGKTLVQAQALGLPIVASRVCGIPDVVAEGETALLVPAGDAAALAAALAALIGDQALRARLGAAGKRRVAAADETGHRAFSVESMVDRLDKIYRAGLVAAILALAAAASAQAVTLRVVTHVHSSLSHNGVTSLEEIASRVKTAGIDVFIPTDTLVTSWEYGVWPLRGLLRKKVEQRSVLAFGVEKYLARIKALRAAFPELVVIPGVEAAPYYRWEGSPWRGLTLNDWNRHMLLLGLEDARDYATLPVLGNPRGGDLEPALLWPLLTLALGLGGYRATRRRRYAALAALSLPFLLNNWPYRQPSASPYLAQTPWAPYQKVIDDVRKKGGLAFWAHPDAPNWTPAIRVSSRVSVRTRPYPEALLRTVDHDGFAALNEGLRRAGLPGGEWDQALTMYLNGERLKPFWAIAELDYRESSKDHDVDGEQMVVDARSRAPKDVLDALSRGRFYAIQSVDGASLQLKRWTLSSEASSAGSGETLVGTREPTLDLELSYADRSTRPAELEIIKDGAVVARQQIVIPYRSSFRFRGDAPRSFYRLIVRDQRGGVLVANPIFVAERS